MAPAQSDPGVVNVAEIPAIDIATLTLGEMAEIELASGVEFGKLLRGRATRLLVALYLADLRSSGPRRSWSELQSLRVIAG